MDKNTEETLLKAIQGLRDDIARLDRDGGDTRTANEKLAMMVSANTEQVNQFGQRLEIIEKKIQDKVADVMAPAMQEVQDFRDVMKNKKVVAIDSQKTKAQINPWWKKLFGR